jgi:hypothetical protein
LPEAKMKKNFQTSIQRSYQGNPLLKLAELGWDSNRIKSLIVDTLDPYFEDKEFLREKAIDSLSAEAANVGKIGQDVKAEKWLRQLLEIHRQARNASAELCFETIGHWDQAIAHGRDEFWSAALMERDLLTLPLDDFKFEVFRTIGTVIEACLQPLLKALLAQVRISRGDLHPNKNLADIELGKVVDELFAKLPDQEIVAPAPWKIRLNQWRNMAQHHKTHVRGDKIIGVYGVGTKQTEVTLTRDEVLEFAARLNFVLSVVRGSRAIFAFDNLQKVEPHFKETYEREDARVFHLAAPFATQGFKIERLEIIERNVQVRISDQIGGDIQRRTAHCSQLVYPIWLHFPYDAIEIEFVDSVGKPRVLITASGVDLARAKEQPEPWEVLASAVKFYRPKSTEG